MLDENRTVRELAVEIPGATRVFEKLKIDYCCGGNQPLSAACAQSGLDPAEVARMIDEARTNTRPDAALPDFQTARLGQLTNYIVSKHHTFTRDELERLTALIDKVCSAHGENHSELLQIRSAFRALDIELEPHMIKEERILFPYIEQLDTSAMPPHAPFGTVSNPIAMMMREHDAAGELLREIRKLSSNFRVPGDACISYQTLYRALEEFEADLHQHIHLENNILFPRAIAVENNFAPVAVG